MKASYDSTSGMFSLWRDQAQPATTRNLAAGVVGHFDREGHLLGVDVWASGPLTLEIR